MSEQYVLVFGRIQYSGRTANTTAVAISQTVIPRTSVTEFSPAQVTLYYAKRNKKASIR